VLVEPGGVREKQPGYLPQHLNKARRRAASEDPLHFGNKIGGRHQSHGRRQFSFTSEPQRIPPCFIDVFHQSTALWFYITSYRIIFSGRVRFEQRCASALAFVMCLRRRSSQIVGRHAGRMDMGLALFGIDERASLCRLIEWTLRSPARNGSGECAPDHRLREAINPAAGESMDYMSLALLAVTEPFACRSIGASMWAALKVFL